MYRACPWSSWTIPADVVKPWVKNCTARFYNHSMGMRGYLLKSNFKFNLQEHHFVYIYEVIIRCYLNFITCLYFPLALIRWNSSHCHLMELFKIKESWCLFIFCILSWNEKELNQQVCLIKYVENEICNSTSHKKEKERSKNIIQLQKHF